MKTPELAIADLESQVAIAEAMQRGEVTSQDDGYYTLATTAKGDP